MFIFGSLKGRNSTLFKVILHTVQASSAEEAETQASVQPLDTVLEEADINSQRSVEVC